MKVAYIMSRFPHLPETFILREMIALEKEGNQISLYPILLQREKVVHPDALLWLKRAKRLSFFSPILWLANIRMMIAHFHNYFSLIGIIRKGNHGNSKFSLRAYFLFPKAIFMAELMKREGIEHIHAHYATHPALAAFIINQLTGIPYSVTVHAHDIFVDQTMLCEKLAQATFVRSISQFNKNFLINQCGKEIAAKVEVIHCGINIANYKIKKNKRKGKFQLLCIGSLQPYKGIDGLIKACALLKKRKIKFTCTIIGGGELSDSLLGLINKYEIDDVVKLVGRKTEVEVVEYLHNTHCYVQPSIIAENGKMEGIPVAIMEAMACKIPVVATKISGIPELVIENHNGFLVPPGDEVALAERVYWFYENPRQAKEMGCNGLRKVKEEFDIDKIAVELNDLIAKNTQRIAGGV